MLLNDRLELVGSVVKVGGKVGGGSSVVEDVSGVARISSMPSITGGLNGAPAGRFQDVFGWVGVRR